MQLFNFLVEYRKFKCNIEHTQTPGSLQTFPVVALTGECSLSDTNVVGETRYNGQTIMVPLKIVLPTGFPNAAPIVTLQYPNMPGCSLQSHEYLVANEMRIPYLFSWNHTANLVSLPPRYSWSRAR